VSNNVTAIVSDTPVVQNPHLHGGEDPPGGEARSRTGGGQPRGTYPDASGGPNAKGNFKRVSSAEDKFGGWTFDDANAMLGLGNGPDGYEMHDNPLHKEEGNLKDEDEHKDELQDLQLQLQSLQKEVIPVRP
jgi:hypothetical protein